MKTNRKLDDHDRKLMALLTRNARMSATDLGRQLNLSRSAVQQRLKRLEDGGIIGGYTIKAAPVELGPVIRAIVQLQFTRQHCPEVAALLQGWPEVQSCWSLAGEEDMSLLVTVSETTELMGLVKRLARIQVVARTRMHVILETHFDKPAEIDCG